MLDNFVRSVICGHFHIPSFLSADSVTIGNCQIILSHCPLFWEGIAGADGECGGVKCDRPLDIFRPRTVDSVIVGHCQIILSLRPFFAPRFPII
jgi:hypothetical protein